MSRGKAHPRARHGGGHDTGACHGALAGKGGLKLSLRGFDPDTDHFVLTRQALGTPGAGIVRVRTTGYNQAGTTVIEFERAIMVYRRGAAPTRPGPAAPGEPL